MKKFITITISAILYSVLLFTLGYQTAVRKTLVTVSIRNNSSFNISAVQIEHEQGTVTAANIKRKKTARINFYSKDQNSYKVSVLFDNNKSIYSDDRLVKPGKMIKEIITDSVITTL